MNRVVRAEISATVATVAVEAGQQVGVSDPVVHLESMSGVALVPAGADGIVTEVLVGVGDVVREGHPMLVISEDQ